MTYTVKKVLFAGLGSIGQRHLRNMRALMGDRVEILAYRRRGSSPVLNPDMTVRAGAHLETTYGIRSFSNLDDALAERPDAVFVTNPNTQHIPVALAAARAGCHLFVEKPISHSEEGMDELISIVEERNIVAFVAYQFRFHPALRWIKQLLDEGRLGHVLAAHIVNGEHLPDWHPYEDYRETHPARRDLGGGCLRIDNYELDYALWLFGMPKRVYAVGGHLSQLSVDVEDTVDILLTHCGGRGPFPVHVHLDYLQRPPQRICEVVGDAGKVRYDYYAQCVEFWDLVARTREVLHFDKFDRNEMFIEELRHFLLCVQGKAKPMVDFREGRRSMLIGLAAACSMVSGKVELLNDV